MKGYKGFEKGLICRGKQYTENTVFEEEKVCIFVRTRLMCGVFIHLVAKMEN